MHDNWALFDATKKDGGSQQLADVHLPLLLTDCHSNFVTVSGRAFCQCLSCNLSNLLLAIAGSLQRSHRLELLACLCLCVKLTAVMDTQTVSATLRPYLSLLLELLLESPILKDGS